MQNIENSIGRDRYQKYIDLAHYYHVAAISLWASILEAPYLFYPCMYLARHTVELILKGLIYRDCENPSAIKITSGKSKKPINCIHDLFLLWQCYLKEKRPSLFPTEEESKRIEKTIDSLFKKDLDSTKYRYPETKNPVLTSNINPIRITEDLTVSTDISKTASYLVSSPNGQRILTKGITSLKQGTDAFELIEVLWLQLGEQ